MKTKTIQVQIPEYLTIDQYSKMSSYEGDSEIGRMVHVISTVTNTDKDIVKKWNYDVIKQIAADLAELVDHKHEFHSIIEWKGKLYGYSSIQNSTLGEYMDIESMTKDFGSNMHKLAATLYRPITAHRFKSLKFAIKQKVKMVNNKVENVFDWYTVEPYDSQKRKLVEEDFRDFPVHIFLGAVSFFLHIANQSSIDTLYLHKKITKRMAVKMKKDHLDLLSQSIGAGGGLFTHSVNPIYLQLPGTGPSPT